MTMKKITKKVLIGSGIAAGFAALASGVSQALTRGLGHIALDRELPSLPSVRSKRRVSGSQTLVAMQELAKTAAAQLEQMPHERVEIQSEDGLTLVGHWFPLPGAKRVVVAMHGWRSSWASDFGAISDFWRRSGCSVLYAEQRAQGDSQGEYMGFGLLERKDCALWAAWADAMTGSTLPVYLAGLSMGATTVLLAAGQPLPASVRGIMADCGFTSAHAIWKHVAEQNLHVRYTGLRRATMEGLFRKKLHTSPGDCSTEEVLRQSKIPVLLIHGQADSFVPVEMTLANYEACAAPKQLLLVPGAGHGMSYLVARETYEAAVLAFWERWDVSPDQ